MIKSVILHEDIKLSIFVSKGTVSQNFKFVTPMFFLASITHPYSQSQVYAQMGFDLGRYLHVQKNSAVSLSLQVFSSI